MVFLMAGEVTAVCPLCATFPQSGSPALAAVDYQKPVQTVATPMMEIADERKCCYN
jgi:hypothetical protein